MATRGFEFAYMLDGSNGTPVIRDFILNTASAYKNGDLVVAGSDGDVDKVTVNTTEVTGVIQEDVAATAITAGTTKAKVAIITRNQVWRCSADDTSITTIIPGYVKTLDTVDANTISHDDITGGSLCAIGTATTDDEGKPLIYVVFLDTTFGNA